MAGNLQVALDQLAGEIAPARRADRRGAGGRRAARAASEIALAPASPGRPN